MSALRFDLYVPLCLDTGYGATPYNPVEGREAAKRAILEDWTGIVAVLRIQDDIRPEDVTEDLQRELADAFLETSGPGDIPASFFADRLEEEQIDRKAFDYASAGHAPVVL